MGLLLIANTINIDADIAAMGEALKLLIGGHAHFYAIGFSVVSLVLQIFIPYTRYVRVLKWLTLALLAYIATVFVVHTPWMLVLKAAETKAEARKVATIEKRDADYAVAKEKCDALAGNVKDKCISDAKLRFGQ